MQDRERELQDDIQIGVETAGLEPGQIQNKMIQACGQHIEAYHALIKEISAQKNLELKNEHVTKAFKILHARKLSLKNVRENSNILMKLNTLLKDPRREKYLNLYLQEATPSDEQGVQEMLDFLEGLRLPAQINKVESFSLLPASLPSASLSSLTVAAISSSSSSSSLSSLSSLTVGVAAPSSLLPPVAVVPPGHSLSSSSSSLSSLSSLTVDIAVPPPPPVVTAPSVHLLSSSSSSLSSLSCLNANSPPQPPRPFSPPSPSSLSFPSPPLSPASLSFPQDDVSPGKEESNYSGERVLHDLLSQRDTFQTKNVSSSDQEYVWGEIINNTTTVLDDKALLPVLTHLQKGGWKLPSKFIPMINTGKKITGEKLNSKVVETVKLVYSAEFKKVNEARRKNNDSKRADNDGDGDVVEITSTREMKKDGKRRRLRSLAEDDDTDDDATETDDDGASKKLTDKRRRHHNNIDDPYEIYYERLTKSGFKIAAIEIPHREDAAGRSILDRRGEVIKLISDFIVLLGSNEDKVIETELDKWVANFQGDKERPREVVDRAEILKALLSVGDEIVINETGRSIGVDRFVEVFCKLFNDKANPKSKNKLDVNASYELSLAEVRGRKDTAHTHWLVILGMAQLNKKTCEKMLSEMINTKGLVIPEFIVWNTEIVSFKEIMQKRRLLVQDQSVSNRCYGKKIKEGVAEVFLERLVPKEKMTSSSSQSRAPAAVTGISPSSPPIPSGFSQGGGNSSTPSVRHKNKIPRAHPAEGSHTLPAASAEPPYRPRNMERSSSGSSSLPSLSTNNLFTSSAPPSLGRRWKGGKRP